MKSDIRIVLVEPAGAMNVGACARVMKNMGLSQLWLVNPQFDFQTDRFSQAAQEMAVHAKDILAGAQIVADLDLALVGCQRAIATSGRTDIDALAPESPAIGLKWLTEVKTGAIVFGREDRGLSNAELVKCQKVMQIPISQAYPSINLAQAVGICCYQLRILQTQDLAEPTQDLASLASVDKLESYYQDLEQTLLKAEFFYPHTAFSRMQKLRHLFNKADLTESEVDMLRGVLRQVNWAISASSTNKN
jgi:tRNA/rRNA methyltransferase